MILKKSIQHVFDQLTDLLRKLSHDEYIQPIRILSNATIGQHVRHIIELFQCLEDGYISSIVNYEKRNRDTLIETDKELAISLLKGVSNRIDRFDKPVLLESEDYSEDGEKSVILSNYYREIAYNLEHTIHHMALIRVGISEASSLCLPEEFGVAHSTIKYRKTCAQ